MLAQMDVNIAAPGALRYVISTKVGSGPEIIEGSEDSIHLLNSDGLPRTAIV